jgi:uncharacterized membrane protein YvbJ
MFCPNCGRQIPDGSKFCPYCGAILTNKENNPIKKQQKRSNRFGLVFSIVIILIVIFVLSAVFLYNHSNNASAVVNKFESALSDSNYKLLSSLITVNGRKPDIVEVQAFCKLANESTNMQDIQSQLENSLQSLKSGLNIPSDGNYISVVKNKSFLIFNSYSISIVPSNIVFSGPNGTVVTLGNIGNRTINGGSAIFPTMIPGEYTYSIELPTILGALSGSGIATVEPLKECDVDISTKFSNSAFYKIPSDIQPKSALLNNNTVDVKSGSSAGNSYLYLGPFPAGAYNVLLEIPAPWGSAEYTGITDNSAGWSTIYITGISDSTYEKLKGIANVIDTYNMNDTLLERNELPYPFSALDGLEVGSPIYIDEEKRISKFSYGNKLSDKYFQMILSSKFFSSNGSEIKVVCAENYALSSPVFVYTVHYKDGKFYLYDFSDFSGSISDYINSPNSVVIKHNW